MTLVREPKKYDPQRGALGAFLYGIARNRVMKQLERAPEGAPPNSGPTAGLAPTAMELGDVVVAANSVDFALLPGVIPPSLEEATVVHVQMQRGGLTALGLSVNEEHGADWIQVDLLVGDDGVPQAVRLPRSAD